MPRRARSSSLRSSHAASEEGVKHDTAASCVGVEAHRKKLTARSSAGPTSASGSTSQPRRQPVMPKYFENEDTMTASGSASRAVRADEPSGAGSASDR